MAVSGRWASRRLRHSAATSSHDLGCLTVTHPFHPLVGQRLAVLLTKKRAAAVVFVCEGGVAGRATVTLAASWTDRGPTPAAYRLSLEGLLVLDTLVTAIVDLRGREDDHLV
jgi:hypothetical protein